MGEWTDLTRRAMLQVGGVGLLSAGLLNVLAARPLRGIRRPVAVAAPAPASILFQVGGPYQCETFDPKPSAPEEIRGPFRADRARASPACSVTEALPLRRRSTPTSSPSCAASITPSAATTPRSIAASSAARPPTRWRSPTAPTPGARDHPHYASVLARLRPAPAVDAAPRHHSRRRLQRPGPLAGPAGRLPRRRPRPVRPRRRPERSRLPRRGRRPARRRGPRAASRAGKRLLRQVDDRQQRHWTAAAPSSRWTPSISGPSTC